MGINVIFSINLRITVVIVIQVAFLFVATADAQDILKEMRSNVIETINGKEYYIHTIKKGQTLYMISKAYGADVNEVIRENPEVKEGIRADQKIRIPIPEKEGQPKKTTKPASTKAKEKEITEPQPKIEPPSSEETLPTAEAAPRIQMPCGEDKDAKKDLYHVALMLPLYLNETDKIDTENPPADPEAAYQSLRFIQFYEGFRIAMDSLQKSGISMNIHVYDVGKDTNNTRRILRNPDLKKMDMIIGLLFHRNFLMVSSFAKINSIPLINPISERSDIISGNPMVFKAVPSSQTQLHELAGYLSEAYPDANIIIIRDIQFKEKEEPEMLAKICSDKSLQTNRVDGYGRTFELLSKEKENILVVFSTNKVFTLDLFNKLNEFRNDYKLTVFGMPKWDEMEGLEPEFLVNLKTHLMTPSFIDYENPEIKRFVIQFQQKYMTDPDPLAFQGFDITYYFLSALEKFGKALIYCIPELRMTSLQNNFHFIGTENNGFENHHWDIYKFENYRTIKVSTN